jgi:hypothetical protein
MPSCSITGVVSGMDIVQYNGMCRIRYRGKTYTFKGGDLEFLGGDRVRANGVTGTFAEHADRAATTQDTTTCESYASFLAFFGCIVLGAWCAANVV